MPDDVTPKPVLSDLTVWTVQELLTNRWTNCNVQTLREICEEYPLVIKDINTGVFGTYPRILEIYSEARFVRQHGFNRNEYELVRGVVGNAVRSGFSKVMIRGIFACTRKGVEEFVFEDHSTFRVRDIEAFETAFPELAAELKSKAPDPIMTPLPDLLSPDTHQDTRSPDVNYSDLIAEFEQFLRDHPFKPGRMKTPAEKKEVKDWLQSLVVSTMEQHPDLRVGPLHKVLKQWGYLARVLPSPTAFYTLMHKWGIEVGEAGAPPGKRQKQSPTDQKS
jgi:hypothetical protein